MFRYAVQALTIIHRNTIQERVVEKLAFDEELEKFFETHIMGRHREWMEREEKNFQRISKQMEKIKDQESMAELLDQLDLRDPFHSS